MSVFTANEIESICLFDKLDKLDIASHGRMQTRSMEKMRKEITYYLEKIDPIEIPISPYDFKFIEKGILINYNPINIECMRLYPQSFKSKRIINIHIIQRLIHFVKKHNIDAIKCLCNILYHDITLSQQQTDNVSEMIDSGLITILIDIISDINSCTQHKEFSLTCLGNICAINEESRNFCLEHNILKCIISLLRDVTTPCSLYIVASSVIFYICKHDVLPLKQCLPEIIMALNVMIMYEYDEEVIDYAVSGYSFLIKNTVNYIIDNNADYMELKNILNGKIASKYMRCMVMKQYQEKLKYDNKIFKQCMNHWPNKYELNVPFVIINEIRKYYNVFDAKKIDEIDCNLMNRCIYLLHDNYMEHIVWNSLKCIHYTLREQRVHNVIFQNRKYNELLTYLKSFLCHKNTSIVTWSCYVISIIAEECFKDIINTELLEPVMNVIINNNVLNIDCKWYVFEGILFGFCGYDALQNIIDENIISLFFKALLTLIINESLKIRYYALIIEALESFLQINDNDNTIRHCIENEIKYLQSNADIMCSNRQYVDSLQTFVSAI